MKLKGAWKEQDHFTKCFWNIFAYIGHDFFLLLPNISYPNSYSVKIITHALQRSSLSYFS